MSCRNLRKPVFTRNTGVALRFAWLRAPPSHRVKPNPSPSEALTHNSPYEGGQRRISRRAHHLSRRWHHGGHTIGRAFARPVSSAHPTLLIVSDFYRSCSSISRRSRCAPAASTAPRYRPLSASRVWGRVSRLTLAGSLLYTSAPFLPSRPRLPRFCDVGSLLDQEPATIFSNFVGRSLPGCADQARSRPVQSRPGHLAR